VRSYTTLTQKYETPKDAQYTLHMVNTRFPLFSLYSHLSPLLTWCTLTRGFWERDSFYFFNFACTLLELNIIFCWQKPCKFWRTKSPSVTTFWVIHERKSYILGKVAYFDFCATFWHMYSLIMLNGEYNIILAFALNFGHVW